MLKPPLWNEIELLIDFFLFSWTENKESLHQFWNTLNGLAAKFEIEGQTNSLVYDIFILNMHNKAVHETLCTEHNDSPDETLEISIAFAEGIKH